jgi:sulfur dioxygenase
MGLKQLFEEDTCTFTYLIWDNETKEAILVDPVDKMVDRDLQEVEDLGLKLLYGLNTHCHADHITGTGLLKQRIAGVKSVISEASGAKGDILVKNGDKISYGSRHIEVASTPGHTDGCVSFIADDKSFVLSGDALFIHSCGRTDFQQGSASRLYDSVHDKLFVLPNDCVVYPGHDYNGKTSSTIGEERSENPRLGDTVTKTEFEAIMAQLNLAKPRYIDVALPANLGDGFPLESF